MARSTRRLPPRHRSGPKKGQFRKRARAKTRRNAPRAASKRTTTRRKTVATRKRAPARRRAPARKRAYRRNPPGRTRITTQLTNGLIGAVQITLGRAGARMVPTMIGLPKEGAVGLAVQAGVAVALGMVADQVVGKKAGEFVLAGALTAPIESLIAGAGIPFLSEAVSPTGVGAYPGYAYSPGPLGAYVTAPGAGEMGEWNANGAGGMGAYVQPASVGYGDASVLAY